MQLCQFCTIQCEWVNGIFEMFLHKMFIYRCKLYYEDRDWKVANLNQLIVKPSHNQICQKYWGGGACAPCFYTGVHKVVYDIKTKCIVTVDTVVADLEQFKVYCSQQKDIQSKYLYPTYTVASRVHEKHYEAHTVAEVFVVILVCCSCHAATVWKVIKYLQ